jgi:hypothetical protein
MQTGDRLGYHPERATAEIAHFHNVMIAAQASVSGVGATFAQKLDENARRIAGNNAGSAEMEAQKQRRLDIVKRAELLVKEAGK